MRQALVLAGEIVPIVLIAALLVLARRRSPLTGLLDPDKPWVPILLAAAGIILGIAVTVGVYG